MEGQGRSVPGPPGRSCTACRRRKIRCDREQPCGYCSKLRIECIYQASGQSPKKASANDVLARLSNIESSLRRIEANTATLGSSHLSDRGPSPEAQDDTRVAKQPRATQDTGNARLVVEEGDIRYVTNSLWTDPEEVEEGETEDEGHLANELGPTFPKGHQGHLDLPFGLNATPANTIQLHPTESRTFALWQVFIESVDPILKIVHIPTTQRLLLLACQNLTGIPPAFESLMFSIYYASLVSMQASVSHQNLQPEERQMMLNRYRIGIEQSLAKANFMSVPSVTTLQALTLYLTCARQVVDSGYIWAMTGLLVRLAMKLGLHRDPTLLSLPPYLSEMRRRLWWQICVLDIRTADDNDTEPLICEHMYDTKFPANVNDSDLDTRMTQPPTARQSRTEMLFTLVRIEITYASRKLVFSPKFTADNGYPSLSVQGKIDAIDALLEDLNDTYLHDYDEKVPICFLAKTSIPMVLCSIRLTVNHPSRTGTVGIPKERLHALVQDAIDMIHYAHGLRSDGKYSRWVWLFQKFIEWNAAAFLLQSVIAAALPDILNRTSNVINQFFEDWSGRVPEGDRRWQRLQNLRAKATAKQTMARSCPELGGTNTSKMAASEQRTTGMPYISSNNQESLLPQNQSNIQAFYGDLQQSRFTQQYAQPPNDFGLWNAGETATWDFDNIPYGTQGTASWEMVVDDEMFKPPV